MELPKVLVKNCLACGSRKVKRRLNAVTGRYEGYRLCKNCRQSQKMRFLPSYNGD